MSLEPEERPCGTEWRCAPGDPDCKCLPWGPLAEHPELKCHRCGGPNVSWVAPSPLWNQVMRGGDISGTEIHDGIVCPTCFAVLAEERGVAELWQLAPTKVHVELQTVTPSGRVWDEATWMWVDPPQSNGGALGVVCPVCDAAAGWFCIHLPTGGLRLPYHEERERAAEVTS